VGENGGDFFIFKDILIKHNVVVQGLIYVLC